MKAGIRWLQIIMVVSYIFIIILSAGCEDNSEHTVITFDNLTIADYPKVDGSTSAHPLQIVVACKLLDVGYRWTPWFDETFRIWPEFEEKPEIAQFILDSIRHSGTHTAFVNLINKKADIILVARSASDDEIELADQQGVELVTKPVALDAFVFIVNIRNPVNSITTSQIQNIYTGNITYWSEVGGTNDKINPYTREPNSGSQELMLDLVMKDLPMLNFPEMMLFGMMGPINRISTDKQGLGYTVYFYEQFMAPNDSLKLLAINGVYPDYESLKRKQYKYTTDVFVVIRKDLEPISNAYKLYQWLLTYEGQRAIEESGYIPYF
ncbi:MAG: substrate-binding domain-containing protein [Bacteroidales bacterium]|nr:substrate-binding domain-containing protein [Bacteroidales bacterium]